MKIPWASWNEPRGPCFFAFRKRGLHPAGRWRQAGVKPAKIPCLEKNPGLYPAYTRPEPVLHKRPVGWLPTPATAAATRMPTITAGATWANACEPERSPSAHSPRKSSDCPSHFGLLLLNYPPANLQQSSIDDVYNVVQCPQQFFRAFLIRSRRNSWITVKFFRAPGMSSGNIRSCGSLAFLPAWPGKPAAVCRIFSAALPAFNTILISRIFPAAKCRPSCRNWRGTSIVSLKVCRSGSGLCWASA